MTDDNVTVEISAIHSNPKDTNAPLHLTLLHGFFFSQIPLAGIIVYCICNTGRVQ